MTDAQERIRPDWSGDERTQLTQVLDYQRATVFLKCAGLTDEAARLRHTPSPLTSVAGVVSHLVWVEKWWLVHVVGQQEVDFPWTEENPDADWEQGDTVPLAHLLRQYAAACASGREIIAGLDLDAVPRPDSQTPISVRAAMLHMIEETSRHLGHLDILRELTDGVAGE